MGANLSRGDDCKSGQTVRCCVEGAERQDRRGNDGEIIMSCGKPYSVSSLREGACKFTPDSL